MVREDEIIKRQLIACEQIGTFLDDKELMTDTHIHQIVAGTVARAKETFRAMTFLVSERQSVQAAMLCRSIFEDMVVAHWLVLHEDDPEFLTERYIDHLDAIRLHQAKTSESHGYPPVEDVSDLKGREADLERKFGKYAERSWWEIRADGSPIKLPAVITELEESPRFGVRLKGEKPILREMFEKAQKWNNQLLHHTPAGMPVLLNRDDPLKPVAARAPWVPTVVIPAYWSYGQLVYLVLDIVPNQDWRPFEPVFLSGLTEGFSALAGVSNLNT